MDAITWPEHLYPTAERDYASWLVNLGGWAHVDSACGPVSYRTVTDRWLVAGRVRAATKDGRAVVELTDAGWTWCWLQGIN